MAIKVGIQLFSVRNMMQKDPIGTIEKVAQAGYKYLEPANHDALHDDGIGFGVPADELKKSLDKFGVKIASVHIFPFNEENCRKIIAYNQRIGNNTICLPMTMFNNREEVLKVAEYCNRMGKIAKEAGMQFLYHNHYHEYQKFDGETVLDTIVSNTDPDYVGLELDTFWTMRGGYDPCEVMKKYAGRIKKLHQKDFSKTTISPVNIFSAIGEKAHIDMDLFKKYDRPEDFTEIGCGTMDIQKIIDTANTIGGIDYVFLEQDFTALPSELESIKVSMANFKKINGLSWN